MTLDSIGSEGSAADFARDKALLATGRSFNGSLGDRGFAAQGSAEQMNLHIGSARLICVSASEFGWGFAMRLVHLQSVGCKVTTTFGTGGEGFGLCGGSVVGLDVGVLAGGFDLPIVHETHGGVGGDLGIRRGGGKSGWLDGLRKTLRGW